MTLSRTWEHTCPECSKIFRAPTMRTGKLCPACVSEWKSMIREMLLRDDLNLSPGTIELLESFKRQATLSIKQAELIKTIYRKHVK